GGLLGAVDGVGVATDRLGDGDGRAEAEAESDTDGLGDGESLGGALGTGIAPSCPSPQARSPPVTGSVVPSRLTDPAATVTSRPATANRAAPSLATSPTRSAKGRNAREVPAVSASSLPRSRSSAPDTTIGCPPEDSGPTE